MRPDVIHMWNVVWRSNKTWKESPRKNDTARELLLTKCTTCLTVFINWPNSLRWQMAIRCNVINLVNYALCCLVNFTTLFGHWKILFNNATLTIYLFLLNFHFLFSPLGLQLLPRFNAFNLTVLLPMLSSIEHDV